MMMKLFLAFCLLFLNLACHGQPYLQVNGVSVHDRPGYNGWNWGAGVENTLTQNWTLAGGWYYNSERRGSGYAYGRYAVYKKNAWDIGIGVGAVTGYQHAAVIPMAFPEMCYAWTCAMFAPQVESTGANVVGLRLRIPIN
jgi:hypothetical protein